MGGMGGFFDQFFGGGAKANQGPKQAKAIGKEVEITLAQAYNGADIKVSYPRQIKCPECNGRGGTEDGVIKKCEKCDGHGVVLMTSQRGNMITQR